MTPSGKLKVMMLPLFAEDAPDEVEEWYDNLPNRRAAQLDPQRERLVARRLVATTRLAGEKPHS